MWLVAIPDSFGAYPPWGAKHLDIAGKSGEYNDFCFSEFAANGDDRVQPIHVGHLQIHQLDVRAMGAVKMNRLSSIGSLGHQMQIWLVGKESYNPLSKDRMVVYRTASMEKISPRVPEQGSNGPAEVPYARIGEGGVSYTVLA